MILDKAKKASLALLRVPFVRDVLTLQMGAFFATGLSFIRSIAYFRLLGVEQFGVYAVVLAFSGTFSIITNFGQNQAALTFFAQRYSRKDMEGMRAVLQYYAELSLFASMLLFAFAYAAPTIAELFYHNATIGMIARIAFLCSVAGAFDTLFSIVFQTIGEIRTMTVLDNVNASLQLVLSLGLLLLHFGPVGIFWGILVSNLLMLIPYSIVYARLRRRYGLPPLLSIFDFKRNTKPFFMQGFWIAVDKNIGNLFPTSFFFVMSLFAIPAQVGIAQLAYKISALPRTVFLPNVIQLSMTVLPKIQAQSNKALRAAVAKILKHSLFFHAIFSFAALLILPPAALILYGPKVGAAITPMLWMILIQIIGGVNVVNAPLFRLLHKAQVSALWGMIGLPIQLSLLALLMLVFSPINAFVLAIFCMFIMNLWLNLYLFRLLHRPEMS